jgi:hypothetical protein
MGFILGFVLAAFVFFFVGAETAAKFYRKNSIEHGCAHYDTTTGIFNWKKK